MADEKDNTGDQPAKMHAVEVLHNTNFRFELDNEKIAAIRACLERGELRISVTGVDIRQGGRFVSSYTYD